MTDIENLIAIWSMRPPPLSSEGRAWEDGARQGWKWANERPAKECEVCQERRLDADRL